MQRISSIRFLYIHFPCQLVQAIDIVTILIDFILGTDQNDYSEFALEWLIDELVEDGDEIVCLRVVDKDSKIASDPSVQQGLYKQEARSLLNSVQKKNEDGKAIRVILEFAVGKVPETIQRMVCQ